jgi:hypothetical protein
MGQLRNLLIWLRPADRPFYFLTPRNAKLEKEEGLWFWQGEKTWLALRPINLSEPQEDVPAANSKPEEVAGDTQWKATTTGDSYAGFALEVGEGNDYNAWKSAVKTKGSLDLALLKEGVVKLTGSDGSTLRLDHNETGDMPLVHRNGVERKWSEETDVYRSVLNKPTDKPLVTQTWGGGSLTANAGGYLFTSGFTPDGKATWAERPVK